MSVNSVKTVFLREFQMTYKQTVNKQLFLSLRNTSFDNLLEFCTKFQYYAEQSKHDLNNDVICALFQDRLCTEVVTLLQQLRAAGQARKDPTTLAEIIEDTKKVLDYPSGKRLKYMKTKIKKRMKVGRAEHNLLEKAGKYLTDATEVNERKTKNNTKKKSVDLSFSSDEGEESVESSSSEEENTDREEEKVG